MLIQDLINKLEDISTFGCDEFSDTEKFRILPKM